MIRLLLVAASLLFASGIGPVGTSQPRYRAAQVDPGGDTFSHGDEITITGSGFPSEPTLTLFAGGADGIIETTTTGQVPDGGTNEDGPSTDIGFNWTRFTATESSLPVISDASRGKVTGATFSGSGEASQECRFSSGVGLSSRIMVKYWARYDGTEADENAQVKFGTFQAGLSDIQDDNGSNFKTNYINASGNQAYNVPGPSEVGEATWFLGGGSNLPDTDGNWRRVEFKIITPSAQGSTGDGQVYYRAMRNSVPSYVSATSTSGTGSIQIQSQVPLYPNGLRYTAYLWQNYGGNNFNNLQIALDDHMCQVGSFAAVELWNDCTPSNATRRNSQRTSAWSSSSITVQDLNTDGFPDGDACLVVLDNAVTDTVLATREITLQ